MDRQTSLRRTGGMASAGATTVTVVTTVLVLAAGLAGCALLPDPGPRGRTSTSTPGRQGGGDDAPVLTAVGDSLTAAGGDLAGAEFTENTWLYDVVAAGVPWAGGWATPGATTEDMLANVDPVPEADVVVIMAGTNDVALGVPFSRIAANLRAIVAKVGAPRVIVSSVPPLARVPDAAPTYNERLEQLAEEEGWEFVDASAGLRSGTRWIDEMTVDGVHPTARGQRVLGAAIRDAILAGSPA